MDLARTGEPGHHDQRQSLINLERAPFGFPPPLELVNEGCTEGDGRFADKSLALWRIAELPKHYAAPAEHLDAS